LDGLTITFGDDGRLLVQIPDDGEPIEGNYRIDGVGVTLANDAGLAVCPAERGSYTFVARKVSGANFLVQNLKGWFMLVKYDCELRLAYMQEAYIKR